MSVSNVVILTDEETADGFRLAGVETLVAADEGEAGELLRELLGREDVGIIAINENYMERVDEKTKEYIEKLYKPIVVTIPSAAAPQEAEERAERLARLIRKAVGFEIKLGGAEAPEERG